jgi:chromate transporter
VHSTVNRQTVSFTEALGVWLRIGLLGFGGPAGQIALMHRVLVEEKRWIGEQRFLHALNYCMLLPGPEAQQLATYVGWMLHRVAGGLAAGLLFVAPGAAIVLALSLIYATWRSVPLIEAIFFGIKAAVLVIVLEALLRIGRRALRNRWMYAIAGVAFLAIFFFDIPFPLIVLAAGLAGALAHRFRPELFAPANVGVGPANAAPPAAEAALDARAPVTGWRTAGTAALWLAIWLGPVAALIAALGMDHAFVEIATFFSVMAVVTFGGAYAVLAYVAQEAVSTYGWLTAGEMLDGLGLAETTPGPLILVLEFTGFLAGFRNAGALSPQIGGVVGALLTLWVTFAPSFLWIFAGAPYVERLRRNRSLSAALTAITAAVVGVVLNLAIWFAIHVLFARVETQHWNGLKLLVPEFATLSWGTAAFALLAALAMLHFRVGMLWVLGGAALLGIAYRLVLT